MLLQEAPSQAWVIGAFQLILFPKEGARDMADPLHPGTTGTTVSLPTSDVCGTLYVCVGASLTALPNLQDDSAGLGHETPCLWASWGP